MTRPTRAIRGALVAAVVVGYLVALGATASGEGLQLLAHLAWAHDGPGLSTPVLVEEAAARQVVTTLRAPAKPHAHGGHTHSHGGDAGRRQGPASRAVHVGTEAEASAADGWHAHDGDVHRHEGPPRAPDAVVAFSLDKHRVPGGPAAARLPASGVDLGGGARTPGDVAYTVETPPPMGRG